MHKYPASSVRRILHGLRTAALAKRNGFSGVGTGVVIGRGCSFRYGVLNLGNNIFIGPNSWIRADTTIGDNVMLAGGVNIVGGDHRIDVVGTPMLFSGRDEVRPTVIGDDVWIGRGATIIHGVEIGRGSIVAAGALVTRSVPENSIVGSPPATVIRQRFSDADWEKHLELMDES